MIGPDRDWQAEDDFRTLQRAEEVKSDKDRHGRALAIGKQQVMAARKVIARGQRMGADEDPAMKNGYRKL